MTGVIMIREQDVVVFQGCGDERSALGPSISHPVWSKLDSASWSKLLLAHPGFAEHCDWSKLGGRDWSRLLCRRPEFAQLCDWSKLDYDNELEIVIEEQPELLKHVPWESVKRDVWASILRNYPLLARRPMKCQLAVDL